MDVGREMVEGNARYLVMEIFYVFNEVQYRMVEKKRVEQEEKE